MKTLQQFEKKIESIPTVTSWYLADLGEARGKQELFTKQSPQKLKALKEHALIESAISSNRIEGVTVDQARVATIVLGKAHLKDRNEEEVRAYRTALYWIHREGSKIPISEKTILKLHAMSRGQIWDAGKYKEKNVHPLIALAAFNLDFLCIHPFRDGNGRVSRLLLLLQCYSLGLEVGRYISLERLIEQNKERYYETLQESSQAWHEGKHDPWPYVNYLLYILKIAYQEFENRVGQMKTPRGGKTELVETAIASFEKEFSISDLEKTCPGVSRDMIRRVLKNLKEAKNVECIGRGPGALWKRKGNTLKRG